MNRGVCVDHVVDNTLISLRIFLRIFYIRICFILRTYTFYGFLHTSDLFRILGVFEILEIIDLAILQLKNLLQTSSVYLDYHN